jgi:hypothetical protein
LHAHKAPGRGSEDTRDKGCEATARRMGRGATRGRGQLFLVWQVGSRRSGVRISSAPHGLTEYEPPLPRPWRAAAAGCRQRYGQARRRRRSGTDEPCPPALPGDGFIGREAAGAARVWTVGGDTCWNPGAGRAIRDPPHLGARYPYNPPVTMHANWQIRGAGRRPPEGSS